MAARWPAKALNKEIIMSEDSNLIINFTCPECAGTVLSVADDEADDSLVTCKGCGKLIGAYGELKTEIRKVGIEQLQDRLTGIFRGKKSWTVKRKP